MTPGRWTLWLVAMGAGTCIALSAGSAVALADTADSGPPSDHGTSQDATSGSDAGTSDKADDKADDKAEAAKSSSKDEPEDDDGTDSLRDDDRPSASHSGDTKGADKYGTDPDGATQDDDHDAPASTVDEPTTAEDDQLTAQPDTSVTSPPAVDTDTIAAPTKAQDPMQALATMATNFWSSLGVAPAVARPAPTAEPVAAASTVTGVRTGHSTLTIPVGDKGFNTNADWYFPTQADGSVSATGVIWLQHGFLSDKSFTSDLAKSLSQQTNSIVVAPNVPSFPLRCSGCSLNGVQMQQAVATMFDGDQEALNSSAMKAGFSGTLPEQFILAGHSAGGGFAAGVGGFYATNPNQRRLRGVVMFDGVARDDALPDALERLGTIPVYQIAAPPQAWNAFGSTTSQLVAARPGQFVGFTLANGSHVDALIGSNPIVDFVMQLVTRFSPRGNTAAVYTLANGWINDLYQGLGPTDGTGIYGAPDEYLVLGNAAGVVLAPAPTVDVDRYLGTWYEVGSVKQFFSLGLVNTKAEYSLNPDGSIRVVNSGNYFFSNGPLSRIVGVALPVNAANNRLNVTFFGPASANPPGNYWIVDLDPDYQWAIVSDSTGFSGFLLTRDPVISDELYRELLNRASVEGVRGWITRTRQPAAESAAVSV